MRSKQEMTPEIPRSCLSKNALIASTPMRPMVRARQCEAKHRANATLVVAEGHASPNKPLTQEINKTIDSMTTFDLHYGYSCNLDKTRISLASINASDEDPPFADQDLNFDARTHNPFGRMYQLVMRHQFEM